MIKKVNVGLVRLADAGTTTAANEDRTPVVAAAESKEPGSTSASGWDPYEVWRTRVKSARDTRSKSNSNGPAG
jgi:hypothetical protein